MWRYLTRIVCTCQTVERRKTTPANFEHTNTIHVHFSVSEVKRNTHAGPPDCDRRG